MNTKRWPRKVGITGACGDLGKEFLRQFIAKGIKVVGVDINKDELNQLENEHKGFKGFNVDLKNHKKTLELLSKIVEVEGVPDLWINAAGIVNVKSFTEETMNEFNKVIQVNLNSVVTNCSFWIEQMKNNGGGTIVNISSVAGLIPSPMLTSYCASKFAVVGFTECLQQELKMKKSNVKVLLVCPGIIETKMMEKGISRGLPEKLRAFVSRADKSVEVMIEKIIEGKEFIDPTLNGKLLTFLGKYSPNLFKRIQRIAMPEEIKELMRKDD